MAHNRIKIFLDVNVYLDILEDRRGVKDSFKIVNGVREKRYEGYVSALTVPILYHLRLSYLKFHNMPGRDERAKQEAMNSVREFNILSLDEQILKNAASDTRFRDYEDAMQYHSAKPKCDIVVTRNKKDFPKDDPDVLKPEEFLSKYPL